MNQCECSCNGLRRGVTRTIDDWKGSDWSMRMVLKGTVDGHNDRKQDLISVASPIAEAQVVMPGQRGLRLCVCLIAYSSSKPGSIATTPESCPMDMLLKEYWIIRQREKVFGG